MKTAVMIRLDPEELAAVDERAKLTRHSRAATVKFALEAYLAVPLPEHAPPLKAHAARRPATSETFQRDPEDCSHRFRRKDGTCPACGDAR